MYSTGWSLIFIHFTFYSVGEEFLAVVGEYKLPWAH